MDGDKLSGGAQSVSKGLNGLTDLINGFINGCNDFFGGLSWVEWAIIIIVFVCGLVYFALKRAYDRNLSVYEKNRIKKYKF